MDAVSYNVADLSADQRHAFEGVLGQPLRDDQQVVVQLVNAPPQQPDAEIPASQKGEIPELPDWVTIFTDLSDEEMAELDALILDRSEGRPQEWL